MFPLGTGRAQFGQRPAFRLFGFPVHVRVGFLLFVLLVVAINGPAVGLWFAGFLSVLLIIHELGHAVAARATGAKAEITLDMFAGYASFIPPRPLRWWEQAGISLAGPAAQFSISVAALYAFGKDPTDVSRADWHPAFQALWFAGPVLALLNLIPALPLDGGHFVEALLTPMLGDRARRVTLVFSVLITVAGFAYLLANQDIRINPVFLMFPLLAQIQMFAAERAERDHGDRQAEQHALKAHEADAWTTGDVSGFPAGTTPSPWFMASLHARNGHPELARDVLVHDLTTPSGSRWASPPAAARDEIGTLVDLLDSPYPHGNLRSELHLGGLLFDIGRHDASARYAAAGYGRSRHPLHALQVARSAAALGDRATAQAWLDTALRDDDELGTLRNHVADIPELAGYPLPT